jgi:8-oxo-dGTP diphosphatase
MFQILVSIFKFLFGCSDNPTNDDATNTGTYTLTGEGYAKKKLHLEGAVKGDWIAVKFELPAVTSDCIIFSECGGFVRTVVRGPKTLPKEFACTYAIPGGFVGIREEPKDAAAREFKEETGLEATDLQLLTVATAPYRDPRQRTYSFVYWGMAPMKEAEAEDTEEIIKTEWTRVDDLVSGNIPMAFDHQDILRQAVMKMSEKIDV